MILDSNDDDSDDSEVSIEDVDVYLNHYRIPKLNPSNNPPKSRGNREQVKFNSEDQIMTLTELAAQKVACHLPFGQVENYHPPVPEPMQCRIAFWSFPQDEEDIRLYTCLANGNADVFIRAEDLISLNCVCDMLQVGFHLSANVKFIQDINNDLDCCRVAITFDRRCITSCSCSCSAPTFWCQHAVAVCLQRIRKPLEVTLRAPVSESLQRLEKNQLQKFAQYLINELPQQILPAAQKLLDELLSGEEAIINKNPAAPDPTAGATINEQTSWCLDDTQLSMDIKKILLKQCAVQPTVCSDIQTLHMSAPPAATEYSQLLRPIRGREPEGLWNLIGIVGEMMKRRDSNFFLLLEIMTEEILKCDKIVTWWFETTVSLHSGSTIHYVSSKNNPQCTAQYSCSNFCDEIVHLWRLAALNPSASAHERKRLYKKFFDWHLEILARHININDAGNKHGNNDNNNNNINLVLSNLNKYNRRNLLEIFPGFKPSMEGCLIDWSDWDEKKETLQQKVEESEVEKKKLSKASKKRKKKERERERLRATKQQNEAESKASDPGIEVGQTSATSDQPEDNKPHNSLGSPEGCDANQKLEQPKSSHKDREDIPACAKHDENDVNDSDEENHPVAIDREPLQELNPERDENIDRQDRAIEPDLQVYFMEQPAESPLQEQKPVSLKDFIKVNAKRLNDSLETLYAKVEGLTAHGYMEESRKLAVKVANEILEHPCYPSMRQLYTLPKRRKKKGSLDNQMSLVISVALAKVHFLCNVLLEDPANHSLVLRLVLFGLEIKRSPAATKPLEVKLINQKQELMALLKRIVMHEEELKILREKAEALHEGTYESEYDALTTLILGTYIFEALALSKPPTCSNSNSRTSGIEAPRNGAVNHFNQQQQQQQQQQPGQYQHDEHFLPPGENNQHLNDQSRQSCALIVCGKLPSDVSLGFHAALQAVSVKVNVFEVDHPLLCEGARRQRGELALAMLIHYKDEQDKLDLILKHLLNKDAILSPHTSPNGSARPTKKLSSTHDPNHPTEASAHFMFELAKTVFDKAGGSSMNAHLFRPQIITQNGGRGIHRRLHMCTLRIALYALGLQNRTSVNWMQRTYNGRASFIHEQAVEIGLPAIKFLCDNWEGYLTPVEVASIADKAACSNDPETKRVAAELAKSCLKHSNNLDFNSVRRILAHCKEQSIDMIKEACIEIEQVAENHCVCADVLFATARAWEDLYKNHHGDNAACYQLRDNSSPEQGTSDWPISRNSHQNKCPQLNDSIYLHWDFYNRVDLVPPMYKPISYKHFECTQAAHRVGIKALDALKQSLLLNNKHSSKLEDDILWLFGISKDLGRDYLHKFTRSAVKSVTNAQVLYTICDDLIKIFEVFQIRCQDHEDGINILLPLLNKCVDIFVKQTRDLVEHYQRNFDAITDNIARAQYLTETANTRTAARHFQELLLIVDSKKPKMYCRAGVRNQPKYVETIEHHKWVEGLLEILDPNPTYNYTKGYRIVPSRY